MKKIILSIGVGLIDDLSVTFYPYHFVRTILSIPFCPLPFCHRTPFYSHRQLFSKIDTLHSKCTPFSLYFSFLVSVSAFLSFLFLKKFASDYWGEAKRCFALPS